ncbi:protein of unknown function [Mycobacterium canettii CIPT 140070008]|nr:protein of unknown function [Mycobacterium canettii CIPT 140070008]
MAVLPACRLGLVVCVATAVITATMVLATPSYACACGAAVTAHGSQATLNHEVALLHWDGTTETIVMQLAMNADTDNVALVVPTHQTTIRTGRWSPFTTMSHSPRCCWWSCRRSRWARRAGPLWWFCGDGGAPTLGSPPR